MDKSESLEQMLESAKKYAEEGAVTIMESCLILAKTYAQKAGKDISREVERIKRRGYKKAVPLELESAKKYAEEGAVTIMESCLILAKTYAQKAGKDISREVERIERGGYKKE
ncbi:hypothetical protein A3K73_03785 [Candidatus Pacearchaeota archaeon RBG_13_36_9]|nr:MAG: hypothetical protein A3K73_03785 [Candidatus Pacearchaeota archaeon RBG_13_36_9]